MGDSQGNGGATSRRTRARRLKDREGYGKAWETCASITAPSISRTQVCTQALGDDNTIGEHLLKAKVHAGEERLDQDRAPGRMSQLCHASVKKPSGIEP